MTKEEFLKKYPIPPNCPIPEEVWTDGLSYCWGYALSVDQGIPWDDSRCPCELAENE